MSARRAELSRRGFLTGSLLVAAGSVLSTACSTDPTGGSASGAKTTLNVWYHAYGEAGTQQAVLRYATAFTKANPDIAVKVTWVPGDYSSKLNATLLTEAAPDVFEIGDFNENLARRGQIAAIDDVYGSAKGDFNKNAVESVGVNGKLYGVKMIDDVMMLYYRKSVLAKAGIKPPTTFDELVAAAKALSTKKSKGLFVGNDGLGDSGTLAVFSNGGDLVTPEGKVAFGSAQALEALTGLKRLHDDKSLLLGFTTDWGDPSAFTQGVVPMQWCGLWAMPAISEALGDDFGVVPWPAFKTGAAPVVRVGGWTSCVNAKGKNTAAAKKFVQWLWVQQADLQKDFAESYGFHVPPRVSVAASAKKLSTGAAKESVMLSQKYGKHYPGTWDTAVSSAFNAAAAKIVAGDGDPASLLADAVKKAQGEIDKQRGA
ncbi:MULTISPECIES: sugar ABC transporter substrate-binding protein [unclassified Streptomyces]|uniref:ABC transporter substrate-binding protein n=1 Tax=unclassified Streptomyces TaxID=2593676 RepID=UPI0006FD0753|nr:MULTISPECIES: sugar ABC transporter substrate-binding protein [unclassified Streptomyces]KQX56309.1 sugar ABC transporter substrate-binding protein [Streptomyces sp. Root1304]KRA97124.1 sugar ABC transporter substrate-binding protein [Streptomyces sp. Root66D1]